MAKKRPPQKKAPSDSWMATFSDLLMLMLTFFVLLLTMSSMDQQAVRDIRRHGLDSDFAVDPNSIFPGLALPVVNRIETLLSTKNPEDPTTSVQIEAVMRELLDQVDLGKGSWVNLRPEGVLIEIDGRLGFEPGSHTLTPELRRFLDNIGTLLRHVEYRCLLHTYVTAQHGTQDDHSDHDDHGEELANWNLALRRADSVAQHLQAGGLPSQKLQIMGYARAAGEREGRWLRNSNAITLELIRGTGDVLPPHF